MKNKISLIRIEHPEDGLSVWRSRDEFDYSKLRGHSKFDDIVDRHCNPKLFPTFDEDYQLKDQISVWDIENYHFAFKSLEQLKSGFTMSELKELIEDLGFEVLMLTVTDYFESDYQVVFKKESIIQKENISFMFL